MKICFISLFSYTLFNKEANVLFGGSEVQLYNIGCELAKNSGIKVSFIVGNFGQNKIEFNGNVRIIRSIKVKNRASIFSKIFSVILQFYYLRKVNADVYVKRAAGPEVFFIALYSRILSRKFIYMTAHEIDCSGEYIRKNGIAGMLYKLGLKWSNVVITQTKEQCRMLKEKHDIDSIVMRSGYYIPEKNTHKKEEFILWVARLENWKCPDIFIEIAKKFPKERFVMIAPISSDKIYAENIKREAIKNNIEFIPGLSLAEVDNYFKNAKLFVNTSAYEGFPNTFIQASMHGVPILSMGVNPDNIINEYGIGFFANNNFQKLIGFIDEILTNKAMYEKISDNAYAYAKNNHNIEALSKELEIVINKT
jgi:glycosyltransferase involved in cell wall biosynthesis